MTCDLNPGVPAEAPREGGPSPEESECERSSQMREIYN